MAAAGGSGAGGSAARTCGSVLFRHGDCAWRRGWCRGFVDDWGDRLWDRGGGRIRGRIGGGRGIRGVDVGWGWLSGGIGRDDGCRGFRWGFRGGRGGSGWIGGGRVLGHAWAWAEGIRVGVGGHAEFAGLAFTDRGFGFGEGVGFEAVDVGDGEACHDDAGGGEHAALLAGAARRGGKEELARGLDLFLVSWVRGVRVGGIEGVEFAGEVDAEEAAVDADEAFGVDAIGETGVVVVFEFGEPCRGDVGEEGGVLWGEPAGFAGDEEIAADATGGHEGNRWEGKEVE